jgi:hypothetical protein
LASTWGGMETELRSKKGRVVGHKSSRSGSISSDTGRLGTSTIELDIAHAGACSV